MPSYPRPQADETAPYYHRYINRVPDGDILATLAEQIQATDNLLRQLPEEKADFRYAPGKWSVKEALGHLFDTERVFTYRALTFARADEVELPNMDQDAWVVHSGFHQRSLGSILDEAHVIRASSIALFRHLPDEAPTRRGIASANSMSVRAVPWILAGHELHHHEVFREKYGI
ncbi:MAG: DinB family protein [Acidobacteriota bacterium]